MRKRKIVMTTGVKWTLIMFGIAGLFIAFIV